jgi:hypothetical protein
MSFVTELISELFCRLTFFLSLNRPLISSTETLRNNDEQTTRIFLDEDHSDTQFKHRYHLESSGDINRKTHSFRLVF